MNYKDLIDKLNNSCVYGACGSGKSTFLMALSSKLFFDNKNVIYFSMEQTSHSFSRRFKPLLKRYKRIKKLDRINKTNNSKVGSITFVRIGYDSIDKINSFKNKEYDYVFIDVLDSKLYKKLELKNHICMCQSSYKRNNENNMILKSSSSENKFIIKNNNDYIRFDIDYNNMNFKFKND